MSSSSTTGLPPIVFDSSYASSSSPTGDWENFNPKTASPAVKYRIFSERINELISPEDRRNNPNYHRPLIPRADIPLATTEDQFNPVIAGSGVALGTGTIAEVGRRALRSPLEAPPVYRSPPTLPEIPSSSSTFISNYGRIALIGTVCVLTGAITYRSMTAYQSFESDLRRDIETNFNNIFNDITSTSQLLLDTVNALITRKERSWFGRIFASRNPNSMGKLLLMKGLALDSIHSEPLRRHQEAQQQYQMALTYTIVDNRLHERIHLAYARSLRLTNSPEADVLAQLNQIPQESPLYADAETERTSLQSQPGEPIDPYSRARMTTYEPFAATLSTRIRRAFDDIVERDEGRNVTPHQLLEEVNELINRKEASWFNQIFAERDPNSIGHLLLTKGIALDSIAINLDADNPESLQRHQEAQQQYQTALTHNIDDDNLRYRIYLAYARSLRLTNSPEALVLAQLNQIPQHSPFHYIAEIERSVLRGQPGEIMDRYQYPFEFLCPITQDIMDTPLYHTHEEHRYYFEGNAIQAWLVIHDTCPLSRRRPLTPEDLSPDEERRNIIRDWNLTKLKQNIVG